MVFDGIVFSASGTEPSGDVGPTEDSEHASTSPTLAPSPGGQAIPDVLEASEPGRILSYFSDMVELFLPMEGACPQCNRPAFECAWHGHGVTRHPVKSTPLPQVPKAPLPLTEIDYRGLDQADSSVDLPICSITQAPFRHPVVAEDGHTYEATAIQKWLQRHARSPLTNAAMGERLVYNHGLRRMVEEQVDSWMQARA